MQNISKIVNKVRSKYDKAPLNSNAKIKSELKDTINWDFNQ